MSNVYARQKSLKGNRLAFELAQIGGCLNSNGTASCFMCDLSLPEETILNLRDMGGPRNFVDAGLFYHANENPWCDFLQSQPKDYKEKILGEFVIDFLSFFVFISNAYSFNESYFAIF